MSKRPLDIREEIKSATKYVCKKADLDLLLPKELKEKFQHLFHEPDNDDRSTWRMHYKSTNPKDFLGRFGIDFDNPTVRDAVALDLVKLDEESVSNDIPYTYPEHMNYSTLEYERYILNRNFRIQLVNLENEWSSVQIQGSTRRKVIRTIDRCYQGVRLSMNVLGFLDKLFNEGFEHG